MGLHHFISCLLVTMFLSALPAQDLVSRIDIITHMNTVSRFLVEEGEILAATTGGLYRYDRNTGDINFFTAREGIFDHTLMALDRSPHGILVLGSLRGNLAFLDEATGEISNDRNLADNEIVDVLAIEDTLWVLTRRFVSVYLFSSEAGKYQFRESYREFGTTIGDFHALEYANGRIWLANDEGLISAPGNFLRYNLYAAANWRIQREADGLPHHQIFDVLYDASANRLYIATRQGLVEYDFTQFITYTNGLRSQQLLYLSLQNGQLYVADGRRAYAFQDNRFELLVELPRSEITAIAAGPGNELWIARSKHGLQNVSTGQRVVIDGPRDNYLGEMLLDSRGRLWVTSGILKDQRNQGTFVRTDNGWINFVFSGGDRNTYVALNASLTVMEDQGGNIWVGSWGGGAVVFDPDFNITPINPIPSPGRVIINTVAGEDTLTVQTPPELLNIIKIPINSTNPFFSVVTDIFYDPWRESIWLLNLASGARTELIQFLDQSFSEKAFVSDAWVYYPDPTPVNPQYSEIAQDVFGDLWIISFDDGQGVVQLHFEGENVAAATYTESRDNLKTNATFSIAADQDGYVWVGTTAGLNAILTGSGVAPTVFDFRGDFQPIGLKINDIMVDSRNNKWFGTDKGLSILRGDGSPFDPQSWVHVVPRGTSLDPEVLSTRPNVFLADLPSENIHSVYLDENSGDVYLGTDAGLAIIRSNPFASTFTEFSRLKVGPNPLILEEGALQALQFYNLAPGSEIKILTSNGQLVRRLSPTNFEEIQGNRARWDGRNMEGKLVNTGVYVYLITNEEGKHASGKVLVVRR